MRLILLALAASSALPLTGCAPDGDAYLRQAGWYEEGNLENQASLALDGIDLVYTTQNGTNFGILTEPGWERMLEYAEATLGEDIGANYCGDGCEGGFASTISLVRDDSETIVTYPMGSPPPVLDDLDGLIATIMGTMTNCVDSYEASIVGECARLD